MTKNKNLYSLDYLLKYKIYTVFEKTHGHVHTKIQQTYCKNKEETKL